MPPERFGFSPRSSVASEVIPLQAGGSTPAALQARSLRSVRDAAVPHELGRESGSNLLREKSTDLSDVNWLVNWLRFTSLRRPPRLFEGRISQITLPATVQVTPNQLQHVEMFLPFHPVLLVHFEPPKDLEIFRRAPQSASLLTCCPIAVDSEHQIRMNSVRRTPAEYLDIAIFPFDTD
jgi:hypothetical protein